MCNVSMVVQSVYGRSSQRNNAKVSNVGVRITIENKEWRMEVEHFLFVDDIALFRESKKGYVKKL